MKKKYFIFTVLIAISFVFISVDLKYFSKFLKDLYSYALYKPRMNQIMFALFVGVGVLTVLPYNSMKKIIIVHIKPLLDDARKNIGKIIITTTFAILFLIYTKQQTKIDTTGIGIVILSFIPWFYKVITTMKLPGGFEIGLRDITNAQGLAQERSRKEENTRMEGNTRKEGKNPTEDYNIEHYIDSDPNIAMVSLRIEIENRLRMISKSLGFSEYEPISIIFKNLREKGVITDKEFYGIDELIIIGNKAAHGNRIDSNVANWAKDNAPIILRILDDKLININQGDLGA